MDYEITDDGLLVEREDAEPDFEENLTFKEDRDE